ncbi:MAG: hypothetical protein A2Y33_12215 [Spirochaetes bacterium GWF1_51_8]|nr:MAG: hypothetical protein A2Y33_12215 [Spirochaetes bacterium GWF1_51_8]
MKKLSMITGLILVCVSFAAAFEWAVQGKSWYGIGNAVAIGKDGTVFYTGSFGGHIMNGNKKIEVKSEKPVYTDMFIAAYDPKGKLLWMHSAGGLGSDNGYNLAVTDDAVYVNTFFTGSMKFDNGTEVKGQGNLSMALVKYDYKGNFQWVQTASDKENMWARDIAVDREGNAYLVGFFTKGASFGNVELKPIMEKNIFIVKYSADGKLEWVKQASGGDSLITGIFENGIETGPDGNIYISGHMIGPIKFENFEYKTGITKYSKKEWLYNYEAFIAKYTPDGKFEWMKSVGVDLEPQGFAVDGEGNFYMTGFFTGILSGKDIGKAKVGNITIKSKGVQSDTTSEDIFIAKWDKDCNVLWAKSAGGPGIDRGYDIAIGSDGIVAITGSVDKDPVFDKQKLKVNPEGTPAWDFFIAWYNTDGQYLGIELTGGSGVDVGNGVAVDGDGGIYATGFFSKEVVFGKSKFLNLKYSDSFLSKIK